jgi:hypothetical protein
MRMRKVFDGMMERRHKTKPLALTQHRSEAEMYNGKRGVETEALTSQTCPLVPLIS